MGMRRGFWALLLMCTMAALPAWAQETRGNINGVISDSQGVIPGATVKITNAETGQTQSLITNETGYFEAPLLQPGPYRVSVEMANFKTINQDVTLSVAQTLSVRLTLEVGNVSETVNVTAEAPILDTTSVSSGQNFDRALIEGLPMAANQPILLSKFAQGIVGPTTQQIVLQGQIDGPNDGAGDPIGGVGSFNYSIDGATNAGNNRRMSASPNSDLIQEMRVETSNFDASQGHGTGANISLMTRAGTNLTRGTVNYQYLDQPDQLVEPAAEAGVRAASRDRRAVQHRPLAQRRLHARRPGRASEDRERPQQAVLLLQLSAELRRLGCPKHADLDGAREREAPRRRLFGPADAGYSRPVSDLRSADRASESRAAR